MVAEIWTARRNGRCVEVVTGDGREVVLLDFGSNSSPFAENSNATKEEKLDHENKPKY